MGRALAGDLLDLIARAVRVPSAIAEEVLRNLLRLRVPRAELDPPEPRGPAVVAEEQVDAGALDGLGRLDHVARCFPVMRSGAECGNLAPHVAPIRVRQVDVERVVAVAAPADAQSLAFALDRQRCRGLLVDLDPLYRAQHAP